ncbi:hypothetical protein AB0H34_24535 [Saccharopolyspora shandongensis]|uniref:hypothetical protein n=1 Tax=Saccharopolyspora shandongensis TaxID=418495 RepID=UPI0033F9BF97
MTSARVVGEVSAATGKASVRSAGRTDLARIRVRRPADIDTLHQRINQLEQHNLDVQQQLDERADDLAAARATNRELMTRLNTSTQPR